MLKLMQRFPFTCVVRHHDLLAKNISTGSKLQKRYDPVLDKVRQVVSEKDVASKEDGAPFESGLSLGTTSFPTSETPNQIFNGIRFSDIPIVHVKATYNNTILSATEANGRVVSLESAGTVGFRNAKKGTNVAAQAAAIALAGNVLKKDITTVRVCLRGIGPGRLPALKALQLSGLNVVSITDTTRLPHNGNRPKKARRL
ncbi:28S ribosomal protein S11, mitochondrial-like [Biomphalaria glabrata]|uniref:28S ribosomal protein S11, mitochondrial-like n=1 Tax=Biomphalaria glabrata TaxID=6526 RepID=A0A2C9KY62_BIOGL|nr:28S ribosomal protein S11, mitochondrial-like [Biomphalaria glabrata]XP_055884226.1 28S ribosomal protein S11, mitochondrial-like [Biomphalaria glabrata]KAI8755395.1 28S ribosomal protein S11; mitochondrial-like [Biomphalaria glabrata]KAI8792906.1 28S ribosomal protein S11, mitochondrial [Biomphalaria glabrata]